jgi:hypothetical protein
MLVIASLPASGGLFSSRCKQNNRPAALVHIWTSTKIPNPADLALSQQNTTKNCPSAWLHFQIVDDSDIAQTTSALVRPTALAPAHSNDSR